MFSSGFSVELSRNNISDTLKKLWSARVEDVSNINLIFICLCRPEERIRNAGGVGEVVRSRAGHHSDRPEHGVSDRHAHKDSHTALSQCWPDQRIQWFGNLENLSPHSL